MLALLTGPRAGEPLSRAVATLRVELRDHEVHSVQHRPGDGVTVGYRVWLLHDSGELVEDYVLISSTAGRDVPDDGPNVVSVNGPSGRLLGWRHPHDPALPGLGTACDPRALEGVLPGTGPVTSIASSATDPCAGPSCARSATRSHVLRQGVAARSRARWARTSSADSPLLAGAGLQVPNLLAARDDGLLVLSQALGTPFVEAIGADAAHGEASPTSSTCSTHWPRAVRDLPRRQAWSDRALDYADAVAASGTDAHRALALGRSRLVRQRPPRRRHGGTGAPARRTRVPGGARDRPGARGPGRGRAVGAAGTCRRRPRGIRRAHRRCAVVPGRGCGARERGGSADAIPARRR